MSQPQLTQRELSKAMHEQEKRRRRMKACNHDKRTFKLGDSILGIPPILVCDYCGHNVMGKDAKERRDEAATVETRLALPSGQ